MLPYNEKMSKKLNVLVNYRETAGNMADKHWHMSGEMLYVFGGRAVQSVNGNEFVLNTGDSLIIAPGAVHATTSVEDGCYIGVVHFSPLRPIESIYLKAGIYSDIKRIFSLVQEEFTLKQKGYELTAEGLILQAAGAMIRYGEPVTGADIYSEEKEHIDEFIRKNLDKTLTLEAAATYAGYSSEYFSRLFVKMMGTSFKKYVDTLKIQAAQGFLEEGVSVSQTAYKLGYDTPSSFCRAFKRMTGVSPSEYTDCIFRKSQKLKSKGQEL